VEIPSELVTKTCFLQFYIEFILAFQKKTCKTLTSCYHAKFLGANDLPLAIMVSDDTETKTIKLLEANQYFGMKKSNQCIEHNLQLLIAQITLMKQQKVPALLDNDGKIALEEKGLHLVLKPHGHGDVHVLLYQTGLAKKWVQEGRKWLVFLQDTNPLVFRSYPAYLGVSALNNIEVTKFSVFVE